MMSTAIPPEKILNFILFQTPNIPKPQATQFLREYYADKERLDVHPEQMHNLLKSYFGRKTGWRIFLALGHIAAMMRNIMPPEPESSAEFERYMKNEPERQLEHKLDSDMVQLVKSCTVKETFDSQGKLMTREWIPPGAVRAGGSLTPEKKTRGKRRVKKQIE